MIDGFLNNVTLLSLAINACDFVFANKLGSSVPLSVFVSSHQFLKVNNQFPYVGITTSENI